MKTLPLLIAMTAALAFTSNPAPLHGADDAHPKMETAVIGGGCFWCTEAQYEMLKGVKSVVSGYAGGHVKNPTYKQICNGDTGHAEVIKIDYDPSVISYRDIIDLFWDAHDPTTLNQQGNDIGPQYRSIILTVNDEQKKIAEESQKAAQEIIKKPIVTEIVPLETFYTAEDEHQDYFKHNPNQGYCRVVVGPKVVKFRDKLIDKEKLKKEADAQPKADTPK